MTSFECRDKLRKKVSINLFIISCVILIHALSIKSVLAQTTTLTRHPYLQLSTEHSIVIRWRTEESLESRVRYWEAGSSTKTTVTNSSSLFIQGELSINPDSFVSGTGNADISSRRIGRTEASFVWEPPRWTTIGEHGPDQRTVDRAGKDISEIVREIISQPGWGGGVIGDNNMVFIISGSGERVAESFNGGGVTASPLLHIEYTLGGIPQPDINVHVAASQDDAEEYAVTRDVKIGSSDLELGAETGSTTTGSQLVGIKFETVDIPPLSSNVEITKAYIEFTVDETNNDFTEHEIVITDLSPNTKYFYEILDESNDVIIGGEPDYFFKTNPVRGTANKTRIWVLGDSGAGGREFPGSFAFNPNGGNNARKVKNGFTDWNDGSDHVDIMLMLGDNAYANGLEGEYEHAVFKMYQDTLRNSVLWPVVGNHEFGLESITFTNSVLQTGTYYNNFTLPRAGEAGGSLSGSEAYYSFDYGNAHFICLDSLQSDFSFIESMKSWLVSDLSTTTEDGQKWIIAFWHHPPYSKGTHDSDDVSFEPESKFIREEILPILEAHGVDLVLIGHSHVYERAMFIHGHYDVSSTFDKSKMTIDTGDGDESGIDGAYMKSGSEGAVYTVAGSASVVGRPRPFSFEEGNPATFHPVMVKSLREFGSVVLDISTDGKRLDTYFIDRLGTELDHFVLKKPDILFTAYNDLSCSGSCNCNPGEKITYYTTEQGSGTPPCGSSGFLRDYEDGNDTTVTLSISGGEWINRNSNQGELSDPGTDAYRAFNEKLDATGVISYGEDIELAFSGMNSTRRYEVVVFGNRGKPAYTDRSSKIRIEGALGFKNKSTFGSDFTDADDADTNIVHGFNTQDGYVTRFTEIDPGADGNIKIIISDGGSASPPKNYVNALLLKEMDM
ncbi:MAG: metallophosphoesterase family protein [Candidatus Scalindua sp. AMX11]|nr:MAG: hypothetical protein DWQ00_09520 [Candidatus Scalindua sp.]NOG83549.1 metallophosphoesterase family protein [Planctomycetota bacterium]RZV70946.1 MAG: metallophosphoesterase family protein [Candidatus Scalindua sp. SCAELEC01]TDE64253.1 MAG: metallophosphoesterase family protein [Candidatus Scalindua sp. AMX11]